jgi:hypothetical protein
MVAPRIFPNLGDRDENPAANAPYWQTPRRDQVVHLPLADGDHHVVAPLGLPGPRLLGLFRLMPRTRICIHLIGGTIKYAHGGRNRRVPKTSEGSMERCGARSIHRLDCCQSRCRRRYSWRGRGTHLTDDEIVLLVMVYAKAVQANVKPKDIKRG